MHESKNTEFKREWKDDFIKTICSFANTEGGKLIIGLNDDGTIYGVKNDKKLLEDLPNKIINQLGIIPKIEIKKKNSKSVIYIHIKQSIVPVSYHGRYYIRSGSVTTELRNRMLTEFLLKRSGLSWDMIPDSRIVETDFNTDTIQRFINLATDRIPALKDETETGMLMHKLNLKENNFYKRAAILLFGKNPQKYFPQAITKIGRFQNETDIISSDIIEGNLFQQAETTLDILRTKYLISNIHFEGIHRREILEYPYEAMREAILNMLIHRDYNTTSVSQIRVISLS